MSSGMLGSSGSSIRPSMIAVYVFKGVRVPEAYREVLYSDKQEEDKKTFRVEGIPIQQIMNISSPLF